MIDELSASSVRGFVRSAAWLAACILAIALVLLPFAWGRPGSAGPLGLAAAAAICLISGWLAEGLAVALHRSLSPLGAMLVGMAVRMAPPLALCMVLALRGQGGQQHLALIGYLLACYLATLALETWMNVRRVNHGASQRNQPTS